VQKYFAQLKSATYICTMEVNKALDSLLKSQAFKEKAKEKNKDGGKLRMFVTRYQRGEVSTGTAVTLLEKFGYTVDIITNQKEK
jgi:ABC-type proline/glycine betaine transport system substrate-binding protein